MALFGKISRKTGETLEIREFSKPDYSIATTHVIGIIQQLVKLVCIHSGVDAKNNLSHWIIETLQNVYLKNTYKVKGVGQQSAFILNEDLDTIKKSKRIVSIFGVELINNISSGKLKCGNEFIIEGIKRAEGNKGIKYSNYFRNLEKNEKFVEDLRRLVKLISLTISGQVQEGEDFYSSSIDRFKVDYSKKTRYSIQEVRAIIIQCIISYFEGNGILDYEEEFKLYTNPDFNG